VIQPGAISVGEIFENRFSRGEVDEVHVNVLLSNPQRGWFACERAVGESEYLEGRQGG
jgi:hypothetical protein